MRTVICQLEFNKENSFNDFDLIEDEYLVDGLLLYLSKENIEIFERKGRVAATKIGCLGCFYETELTNENPNL